jgi:hypothetical protein
MKRTIDFPVVKKEEDGNLAKRREDYALKRDIQAQYNNQIISKRVTIVETETVKCEKCGKEFSPEIDSENALICPECRTQVEK